ncbi:Crp/Fnr family transcriptional regulator [bacterium SCSIO 12741]|nr:Crp/Fnr family transcriptional regulator [bacterium SCSIO 12741]
MKRLEFNCDECGVKDRSFFSQLCGKSVHELARNKTCTIYKKNQVIFHEGTRPLGVFCINSGKVKIYKTGSEGKDQIIRIMKGGDLMGYRAMLSEEPYPVSAETLEETSICFVPKSDFLDVLKEDSELNANLLRSMSKEMGLMADSITNLAQKPVRERLAGALLMLQETYSKDTDDHDPIEINLTREDLANIVGTATETLIRLLHDFKAENLIETQGRKIRVIEPKKLLKVANLY